MFVLCSSLLGAGGTPTQPVRTLGARSGSGAGAADKEKEKVARQLDMKDGTASGELRQCSSVFGFCLVAD